MSNDRDTASERTQAFEDAKPLAEKITHDMLHTLNGVNLYTGTSAMAMAISAMIIANASGAGEASMMAELAKHSITSFIRQQIHRAGKSKDDAND